MFSYNSRFSQIVNQILDCFFLSMIWLISSLPVITIGAATTALYHTVDKVLRREEGGIWKEYWRVFRRDFKRATCLWLIMVLVIVIVVADFYAAFGAGISNETLQLILQVSAVFLTTFMAIWLQYWFPYLSRFDDPVITVLKNTMAMTMAETGTAVRLLLLLLVVVATDVVLSKRIPVLTIVIPVAYISSLNRILERLFVRYIARSEEQAQQCSEVAVDE